METHRRPAQENGHGSKPDQRGVRTPRGGQRSQPKEQDIRNVILNYFKGNGNKKLTFKQLRKSLGERYSNDVIFDALKELVHDKHLQQRGQAYVVSGMMRENKAAAPTRSDEQTLEGRMDLNQSGMGFVTVEGYDRDIRVNPRNTNQALPGDTVRIVLLDTRGSARIEGRVVEIVERKSEYITGTLEIAGRVGFLVPDKKNLNIDFFVNPNNLNGAQNGDKVVVKFLEWKPGEKNPEAEVVRILGQAGEHDTEMLAILVENGFRLEFPKEVMDECNQMEERITAQDEELRKDFRSTLTFTIDPADAKDFDDALSFKELANGLYEIGIHIADVTHYVHADTMTDIEAALRGTSVYLVDRVVPMLPERLSNELCSLRPHEDKRCFSVVVQMDEKGRVVEQ
ncbi:MAG TPA: RNB domain-containing ribonuclease, partial [Chitinophagales bacterium]|nr:RNB domain-containing ribonuclease [Chitinophagales bacterium]